MIAPCAEKACGFFLEVKFVIEDHMTPVLVRKWLFCLVAWLAFAVPASAAAKKPIVILISIDGLASFYLDDPKAEIPTMREMMAKGAYAAKVEAAFPTITQTNHAALVTGVYQDKHGILANKVLDRERGEILLPHKHLNSRVDPIYRRAQEEGLQVAVVSWPGGAHEPQTSWKKTLPDEASGVYHISAQEEEPIDSGELLKGSAAGAIRNDLEKAKIVCRILERNPANLIVVRFSSADTVQHNHAPRSEQAYSVLRTLDEALGKIIETIRKERLEDRTTVVVVSDHGFLPYSKRINLNALLREEGWWNGEDDSNNKVLFMAWSGAGFIYILDKEQKDQIVDRLRIILPKTEGVEKVLFEEDFPEYHLPTPQDDIHAPDVVLAAKPDYGFSATPNPKNLISQVGSVRGGHGYLPLHPDLSATFVAWGAGVKPGQKIDSMRIVDVEPTIRALLGLKAESSAEGQARSEILQ